MGTSWEWEEKLPEKQKPKNKKQTHIRYFGRGKLARCFEFMWRSEI
jgi:hypothetical protein